MRFFLLALLVFLPAAWCDDSGRLLRIDHYVRVKSAVPSIEGQTTQIYVREVVRAGAAMRAQPPADRVALFIHGAGTPAEVAFDAPYEGYSWMEYLANAGFDVFSMDMTGYGRSTRPAAMNDPCNLTAAQQPAYVPQLLAKPCAATYPHHLTTLASDWHDIDGVVDYVRGLRHVDQVSLLGWSLGGPRSMGYTAKHAEKVRSLVLLAPAYNRNGRDVPGTMLTAGVPFNTQSQSEFHANWDRQIGCPDQYQPAVRQAVWQAMLESDPVGATWATGVRRAPNSSPSGWNQAAIKQLATPALLIAGAHDAQVTPAKVKELYEDLGAKRKLYVDLACSSHNALWESNRLLLFQASLEWLTKGTVNGLEQGTLRLGY